MAITYAQGNHRAWAAGAVECWHCAQIDTLRGKLSKSDRNGMKRGIERTGELIKKLCNKKSKLSHDDWDDVLMYVWQEVCD